MRLGHFGISICGAILASALTVQASFAALAITEVASTSGATELELAGLDWWELTNTGPGSVLLDGYEWEDNNPQGAGVDTAIFPNGVSVAAGESIIIHQGDNTADAAFRAAWGLSASVQILTEDLFGGNNTFSGLSSNGDQLRVYDPMGAEIAMVDFPSSTSGITFEWDRAGNSLGLSVAGENGAYAISEGRVGSPGTSVPEPATLALLGLAASCLVGTRRR